jgi:hypothetical protein
MTKPPFAPAFQGHPQFPDMENRDGEGVIYGHQSALDYRWIINQQINDCRRALNYVGDDQEMYFIAESHIDTFQNLLIAYIKDDFAKIFEQDLEKIENEKPKVLADGNILWNGKTYFKGQFENMFLIREKTKFLRKRFESLILLATRADFIMTGRLEDEA